MTPLQLVVAVVMSAVVMRSTVTQLHHAASSKPLSPPLFAEVPHTSFRCEDHRAGYYADMEAGCQAYHMCDTIGKQYSYLCPNMTLFNQRFMVCDHWHYVNCSNSGNYYDLNMRMAGGGKKLPQAGRQANLIQDEKISEKIDKKTMIKKIQTALLNNHKRTSLSPLQPRDERLHTPTVAPVTASKTTQRTPTVQPATRSPALRPLMSTAPPTTSRRADILVTVPLPFFVTPKPRLPVRVPSPFFVPPNPGVSPRLPSAFAVPLHLEKKTNTFSTISSSDGTTARPTSPISSRPATPSTTSFNVTQIKNFSEGKRNQSAGALLPDVRMFPGLVARGSRPRVGFGSTQHGNPPPGHIDVPKDVTNSPLLLEIARQIISKRRKVKGVLGADTTTPPSDAGTTSATVPGSSISSFVFPKISMAPFPVQPVMFDEGATPRPIVMSGPRQEYITELQARRNGRDRVTLNQPVRQHSVLQRKQAFFIPETRLIPPEDIKISSNLSVTVNSDIKSTQTGSLNEGRQPSTGGDSHSHDHDHGTMIFPDSRHSPRLHHTGGLLFNSDCPECHPAFLTPGLCTPCVRIR